MAELLKNPYIMVKPYTSQHLEKLLEKVSDSGLNIKSTFATNQWSNVARSIYQRNIDTEGELFRIGLEGHIHLVNHFFGDNALVLFVEDKGDKEQSIQETLCLAQSVKREFRKSMPAGQNLQDIVIMMNLDEIGIGCDTGLFQVGLIGMQTNENDFQKISKHKGRWDYYYFKYIHVPDDIEGCINEINILDKMGVLDSKNEVTFEDFMVMAKLKTLTPIKKLKEYL